jgi:hypothetical protein
MFTRVVEITCKSGKAKELSNTINEKVLPILKKQTGFIDEACWEDRTRMEASLRAMQATRAPHRFRFDCGWDWTWE